MEYFQVTSKENGERLDKAVCLFKMDLSRTYASVLIKDGHILLNKALAKGSVKVKTGDEISVDIPEVVPLKVTGEEIPLDIVYEDDDLIVINKPQGMVVHPCFGHTEHTLVNALLNHSPCLSGINGVARPGIVHRLDKDTAGLLVVCKNDKAHREMARQFKEHSVKRVYIALVKGIILENTGTISLPLGRDPRFRKRQAVMSAGKNAVTEFKVLKRFNNYTLVKCSLITGRTHQIRVHFAYIKHPVIGDELYGGKECLKLYKKGQLLVSVSLTFIHPSTKKEMTLSIPLPAYFTDVINSLQ